MTARKLLSPEAQAIVDAFEQQLVGHPLLVEATNDVRAFIANPVARPIGLLVGPTGVGKSTLLTKVVEGIEADRAAELAEHPQRRAVVKTSVPSGQKVSLKTLYASLLHDLEAPLADRRIDPAMNRRELRHKPHTMTEAGARLALINEIEWRRPTVIIFDEADHFTHGRGASQLLILADVFKDLAIQTGLPILLAGTYAMLAFRGLTAQFDRRVRDIHLRPYRYADRAERMKFAWAVAQLAGQLPIPQPDLADDIEAIYERTMGCVGHVYEWFVLALVEALADGTERVGPEHLERARLPLSTLAGVRAEITEGSKRLTETKDALVKHRRQLGLPDVVESPAKSASGAKRKPFARKPARDPIGVA
jgi:hypothetical protein